jgi:hypothetical protein
LTGSFSTLLYGSTGFSEYPRCNENEGIAKRRQQQSRRRLSIS